MKFTWQFQNGFKTQEFIRGGLSMTTIVVDYLGVVNEETGTTCRFESSKARLTRRGVILWESLGTVETHKLGSLIGITLEGIRGFNTIDMTLVPGLGVKAELRGNGTVILAPSEGGVYYEKIGTSERLAHRFMRWLCCDSGGWGWVCDLMK